MGGRPSKPTALIISEKKSHRTKAELAVRETAENALYTGIPFKEKRQVKDDPIAHEEFLRLKKLYSKIQYIDGLDENIINQYCLEISAVHKCQEQLNQMDDDIADTDDFEQRMTLYDKITKMYSTIDRKKAMLLKYEDRLLLNPAGRMRAIPKKPIEEEKSGGIQEFLKLRGGMA